MRRGELLNPALAAGVARLGHGDVVAVVDAGFPIPADVPRVDLAVDVGIPTIAQVLEVVLRHVFAERLLLSEEMRDGNPRHYEAVLECFRSSGVSLDVVRHDELVARVVPSARLVVRTGDFAAWGSVAFVASTEPSAWFTEDAIAAGLVMPESYRLRIARMGAGELPS